MALPSSGPISLSNVNVELGLSATAQISLNDSAVRTLFGIGGGAIGMANGYGKANEFTLTISSNTSDLNVSSAATTAGWNGSTKLNVVINSGIYVSASSTANDAMTISGSYPNGLYITNNGYICGMGGKGGNGNTYNAYTLTSGSAGGKALSVSSATTFTNNGTIAGGGGGGGGGGKYGTSWGGGGGGGGGRTGHLNSLGGTKGYTNTSYNLSAYSADGAQGTSSSAGAGGTGARAANPSFGAGSGGTGGDWGASGSGGGSGNSGGSGEGGAGGGSAGACLTGNNYITWVATGSRYGVIS